MPSLAVTTSVRLPSAAAMVDVAPYAVGICTYPYVPRCVPAYQCVATPLSAAELQLLAPVAALYASTPVLVPTMTSPLANTGACSPGFAIVADHATCRSACASATSVC